MKLRTLTALAALALSAACANEAAKGDRNYGNALEGGAPGGIGSAPAPQVTVDTVQPGNASTTTDPQVVEATDVTTTPDSAAKAQMGAPSPSGAAHDSAAPAAHP
jgi:hypothetical protein